MENKDTAVHNLCVEIADLLANVVLDRKVGDNYVWMKHEEGYFTVKSWYSLFFPDSVASVVPNGVYRAMNHLWNSEAPDKMEHFGWRLLLDRIPSKDQLFKHDILMDTNHFRCVFYS